MVLPTPVGADHRDDAAAFDPTLADGFDATRHQREREAMRFGQFESLRQLRNQLAGEIVREAEHRQLLQQLRLDRRATRQIVPRERRELRLQHAAQGAQFFVHIDARVGRSKSATRQALRERGVVCGRDSAPRDLALGSGEALRDVGAPGARAHRRAVRG